MEGLEFVVRYLTERFVEAGFVNADAVVPDMFDRYPRVLEDRYQPLHMIGIGMTEEQVVDRQPVRGFVQPVLPDQELGRCRSLDPAID